MFDSLIAGGKRYDLAAMGRRVANATFFASHAVDTSDSISYRIDITELVNSNKSPVEFINVHIEKFKNEIYIRIEGFM